MKRTLLIVLLVLGTIGGFAAGCRSLARHHAAYCAGPGAKHPRCAARSAFEDEVADVCVRAARRANDDQSPAAAGRAGPNTPAGASTPANLDERAAVATNGGATIASDRAAAAVDRAAAAAERAAAAAERAAASVERATLGGEPTVAAVARPAAQAAAPRSPDQSAAAK